MSLSSLHGGADSTAFSQTLRKECGWPVLAAWFTGYIGQVWDASPAEASAARKPLKRFTGSPYGKDRLAVHLEHNYFGWHNGQHKGGRQDVTPVTLIHRCNDFNSGICRAHTETVNTATASLLLELQRGYYYGYA